MAEASAHISYGTEKDILMPEVRSKYISAQSCIKVINNKTHVADCRDGMHPAEWAALFQHAIKNPMDFTVVMADAKEVKIEFDEAFTESELIPMSLAKLTKIYAKLGGTNGKAISGKTEHVKAILGLQIERDREAQVRANNETTDEV